MRFSDPILHRRYQQRHHPVLLILRLIDLCLIFEEDVDNIPSALKMLVRVLRQIPNGNSVICVDIFIQYIK